MKTKLINDEIERLIKARYPIIVVNSAEEMRAELAIREIADRLRLARIERGTRAEEAGVLYVWTVSQGIARAGSDDVDPETQDPAEALRQAIVRKDANALFIFKDLDPYIEDPQVRRLLKDAAYRFQAERKTVILLQPHLAIPEGLDKLVATVDYPLPDQEELADLLQAFIERLPAQVPVDLDGGADEIARAMLGLTTFEAQAALAKATVANHGLDRRAIAEIVREKAQIVRKAGVLEFFEAQVGYDQIGGLELLKEYARQREIAYSSEARQYGIEPPRGILILGVPGCGKSLTAKAIAGGRRPLLRLDVSALMGSLVGQSEGNLRQALAVAEAVAPCVLWIDEVEKGLSGVQSSGQSDAGTTARMFGSLLTWMEERTAPVYVVATANDPSALPPELFRRFDAIFFVDLPTLRERQEIFRIHLLRRGRKPENFDVETLAVQTTGFTGSEIETAVKGALFRAFADGREVTTEDIAAEIAAMVPLGVTMAEKLEALRAWAANRARPASAPESVEKAALKAQAPLVEF